MANTPPSVFAEISEEESLLRESAIAFCERDAHVSRLKALKESPVDFDRDVWQKMAELGWSAILVPEALDGLGLDLAAFAILVEQLGRVVAPEPLLEAAGVSVSLLVQCPASEIRDQVLRSCATSDVLAITCPVDSELQASKLPSAKASGDGFIVNGKSACVPIAKTADGFLVTAMMEAEPTLFWIPKSTLGVSINSRTLADNTSHAELRFIDAAIPRDHLLARGSTLTAALQHATQIEKILSAAYLCGLMSEALETTLEYLRTRKQFGKTIGSFQALQHRCVDLYMQREIAAAVVADVVHKFPTEQDPQERALLAGRAKYRTSQAALQITREAIQLHGAIGFTYECDIGHFLNRAMVYAARDGSTRRQIHALGAQLLAKDPNGDGTASKSTKAVEAPDNADLNALSDDEFRMIAREWFEANYPSELRYPPRRLHWDEIKSWYMQVSAKGWLAPSWPVEYGGMGLSPSKVLVFIEEQERWGVARAPDMGITMIGPLLIQHGTAAQREQYLPKILAGENIWCQGYSEPNAGSDLASLQCSAELDGDEFVVNGQKTWTTLAQDATNIFLLVRTDKSVKQQAGISFLLVDIESPGIAIRPIRNLAGDEEFCEVFFDNVRVPAENLVGELNSGWRIAKALLSFERIFLGSPKQSQYALLGLTKLAQGVDLFDDASFRDRFIRLKLDTLDLEAIYTRFAEIVRRGGTLGPDVSLLKIWATETFAALTELMIEAAGEHGAERGEIDLGAGAANVLSQFYNARPATIYGGSNEIQRNIIAKHVLSLPAD